MLNIAVDGTSASGKSSVCKEVAKRLNIYHLNTGALYRANALFCKINNLDPEKKETISKVIKEAKVEVKFVDGNQLTYLNEKNVSELLQTTEISEIASILAQKKEIRNKIKSLQKQFAKENDVLMEGRDIATEILPNANFKFFITATIEERAKRRFLQLKEKNPNVSYDEILQSLKERDFKDEHRKLSPLIQAKDSILIDTTNLTFNEVVEKVITLIKGN